MQVHRVAVSPTMFLEMMPPWALLPAGFKRLHIDCTFLIGSYAPAVFASVLFNIASATLCEPLATEHPGTKRSHWLAVEPLLYGHVPDVVAFGLWIQAVIFLTTDSQATIPVDLYFIPWSVAEDIGVRHEWSVFDRLVHSSLLLARS